MIKRKLLLLLFFASTVLLWAQSDGLEMVYTHVKTEELPQLEWTIDGYKLKLETDSVSWESELLQPLDRDSLGLLFGVQIPSKILDLGVHFTCTVEYSKVLDASQGGGDKGMPDDPVIKSSIPYAGVSLSKIQLEIVSEPKGAEVYLIPNRVWMRDFEGVDVDAKQSELQRYRVNSAFTNTNVIIDQTVFRILFRLGEESQNIVHYTKPQTVEPTQRVFVQF